MLLLDAGDALVGGGKAGDDTQGLAIVLGMGLMGYDAMALGPKELSLGSSILQQRIAGAEEQGMRMLSANVIEAGTDSLVVPAYTVLNAGDRDVAVIGLTRYPDPDEQVADFEVRDPAEALATVLPDVAELADTVILLTNLDQWTATALAMTTPGLDAVIAARPVEIPDNYGLAPDTMSIVIVADKVEHDKVHGEFRGRHVGVLQVDVSADGTLTNPVWESVPMGYTYDNDPSMTQLLEMLK